MGERSSFVTMWAGRLDPHTGDLSHIDAGHGSAVIISPRGLRVLQQGYLPLGITTDELYEPDSDRLETRQANLADLPSWARWGDAVPHCTG